MIFIPTSKLGLIHLQNYAYLTSILQQIYLDNLTCLTSILRHKYQDSQTYLTFILRFLYLDSQTFHTSFLWHLQIDRQTNHTSIRRHIYYIPFTFTVRHIIHSYSGKYTYQDMGIICLILSRYISLSWMSTCLSIYA